MTITPDQARELLDGATPGPWTMHRYIPEDFIRVTGEDLKDIADNGIVEDGDAHLIAAAPDLAQAIAGMTEEWGVERDRPGTAYIDGTVARLIAWFGDEASARKACAMLPRGGNPRLVSRLVGPVEVVE